MQVISYNVISAMICEAALVHRVEVDRLSLKGTVDTLLQLRPLLAPAQFVSRVARRELLRIIAADLVTLRPVHSALQKKLSITHKTPPGNGRLSFLKSKIIFLNLGPFGFAPFFVR